MMADDTTMLHMSPCFCG